MLSDSTLSVKDATGRHISLLNDQQHQEQEQQEQEEHSSVALFNTKRKYHCVETGCNKSFTTSGHLARHHRIHTGEKNFHCLHPGCPSRFSRQDNMMQHYRTHLSPKSRRQHQQQPLNHQKPKISGDQEHPHLHCHTMVVSEEQSDMHPLVASKATDSMVLVTRSRRATTLPSSFQPYVSSLTSPTLTSLNGFYTRKQDSPNGNDEPSPSSPYRIDQGQQQHHHHHYQHHQSTVSHWLPSPRPLIQSLSNLIKPLPMEPVSTASPTAMATSPTFRNNSSNNNNTYHPYHQPPPPPPPPSQQQHNRNHYQYNHHSYQPYHISRRPQRAHSASSTCSSTSSSSFLSPHPPTLSPPPLVDPADVIYPKHFIQLPPPPHILQQENQHQHHIVSNNHHHHHEQGLSGSAQAVSIFG